MEVKANKVRVALRIRPPLPRQISKKGEYHECVAVPKKQKDVMFISTSNKPIMISDETRFEIAEEAGHDLHSFTFDRVYGGDTTQSYLYDSLISDSIKSVLNGYNATVFAYGQTGSGKTFTMQGESFDPRDEVCGISPRAFGAIFKGLETARYFSVKISMLQIHKDVISDLLGSGHNLKIKQEGENTRVEGLTQWEVSNIGEAVRLLMKAKKKRAMGQTCMNEVSSRSHSVLTITVVKELESGDSDVPEVDLSDSINQLLAGEQHKDHDIESGEEEEKGGDKKPKKRQIQISKLNLVDLAGSERVKKSGSSGEQLQEAKSINKSLFALVQVVEALTNKKEKKIVPYRDSKLTLMLKDSLGGNCVTTVLAMVSPSFSEVSESMSTLKFATACKYIENKAKINRTASLKEARNRLFGGKYGQLKRDKKEKKTMPWKGINYKEYGGYQKIQTAVGEIACLMLNPEAGSETIILLHGNPSYALEFQHFFPSLLFSGYRLIAIDMPGYGHTKGTALKARSEFNLDKGGPVDVVASVMDALKIRSVDAIIGYDWGAGILLSFGIKYPKRVKKLVTFLPSYAEIKKDELKTLTPPTLVLWVKQDVFHSWTKWKALAQKIPKATIEVIDARAYSRDIAYSAYSGISDKLMRIILMFLGKPDPLKSVEDIMEAERKEEKSTTGKKVMAIKHISLASEISPEEQKVMIERRDPVQEAVQQFQKVFYNGKLKEYYDARLDDTHPLHIKALKLFNSLPQLSQVVFENDPTLLVRLGVWDTMPQGWAEMRSSKRYLPGREVLVKIPACNKLSDKSKYMAYDEKAKEQFISHRGRIVSVLPGEVYIVEVPTVDGGVKQIERSLEQLGDLNGPHKYGHDEMGRLYFEDGLRCEYKNNLVKAKLLEISLRLSQVVEELSFTQAPEEDEEMKEAIELRDQDELQLKAIKIVRRSLNLIIFGDKGVDRSRVGRTDNVALMALNGQGQCHGVSSTMSAFLYPFTELLGIDLKYRGGFSFTDGENEVSNAVQRHQWLEVTLRPSLKSYLVDLFYEGTHQDDKLLSLPISEAYTHLMYPREQIPIKNTPRKPYEEA